MDRNLLADPVKKTKKKNEKTGWKGTRGNAPSKLVESLSVGHLADKMLKERMQYFEWKWNIIQLQ